MIILPEPEVNLTFATELFLKKWNYINYFFIYIKYKILFFTENVNTLIKNLQWTQSSNRDVINWHIK
jgi:hypothetical protein